MEAVRNTARRIMIKRTHGSRVLYIMPIRISSCIYDEASRTRLSLATGGVAGRRVRRRAITTSD